MFPGRRCHFPRRATHAAFHHPHCISSHGVSGVRSASILVVQRGCTTVEFSCRNSRQPGLMTDAILATARSACTAGETPRLPAGMAIFNIPCAPNPARRASACLMRSRTKLTDNRSGCGGLTPNCTGLQCPDDCVRMPAHENVVTGSARNRHHPLNRRARPVPPRVPGNR